MSHADKKLYEFDKFSLDVSERILWRDGKRLPLSEKAFDTLFALVRRGNHLVGKDELLNEIWADAIVEENNLDKNISILRQVLGERAGKGKFIETVRGHGFRFVAEVREIGEEEKRRRGEEEKSEEGSASADELADLGFGISDLGFQSEDQRPKTKDQKPNEKLKTEDQTAIHDAQRLTDKIPNPKSQIPNRNRLVLLTILSFLTIGAAGYYFWRGGQKSVDAPIKTIAVLPFKPLVPANRSESLELGMADTLINKISSSDEIVVRPLGSVRRYNNLEQDGVQAGRELGVDSVLEGTIQMSDERVRIAARLVRTSDGKPIWTETFDEKSADIFAVQDSISNKVLAALTLKLSGAAQKRLTRRDTENAEAYQLYMRGRFHAARLILPEARKGIEYFNQAIALDANYALAYVGIAQAYTGFSLSGDVPANEAMPKGKAAAQTAIELAPNLPEAQVAVGQFNFWYEWNWTEAEKNYRRALELDPNNAAAQFFYAHLNSNLGQHGEALKMAQRARELDPLNLIVNSAEGQFLFFAGQPDEAVSRLNKTLELEPNFWHSHLVLSSIYAEQQKFAEAFASATRAAQISGGNSQAVAAKGYALAKSGNLAQARIILDELQKLSTTRYVPPYNFALVYNGLGESDKALDYLEKAFADKNVLMVFLKVEPKWNNLRNEPRFIELMRRMNFE